MQKVAFVNIVNEGNMVNKVDKVNIVGMPIQLINLY